jgi:type IV pilus assembly protein PilC
MPFYRYKALDDRGGTERGKIFAPSESGLLRMLKDEGLYTVSYVKIKDIRPRPFKAAALAEINRQLGRLTGAGLPLTRALDIMLQEETATEKQKSAYKTLIRLLGQGLLFSSALKSSGFFPPLMISIYRASEDSGSFSAAALRLAELYDKEHKLITKLKGSSAYTKTLAFSIMAVISFLFTYLLPKFEPMFSTIELPESTKLLLGLWDTVKDNSLMLLVFIAVLLICLYGLRSLSFFSYYKDKLKLRLPLIGKVFSAVYTARFARTFSSLYGAGLSFVPALETAMLTIGNDYISRQFGAVIAEVSSGGSLSSALMKVRGLRKKLAASILVGEETGALETMLSSSSEALDFEAEAAVSKLTTYLEPALIIFMSIIVCFLILAVILPVFKSYSAMGALAAVIMPVLR